jgi:hypothetical protein
MVRGVITRQLNSARFLLGAPLQFRRLDFAEERCDILKKTREIIGHRIVKSHCRSADRE